MPIGRAQQILEVHTNTYMLPQTQMSLQYTTVVRIYRRMGVATYMLPHPHISPKWVTVFKIARPLSVPT